MAKKTVFYAVVNGIEVTRTTHREYTHAVVWAAEHGKEVNALSFAGSLQLAQKAFRQFDNGSRTRKAETLTALGLNPEDFEILERTQRYHEVLGLTHTEYRIVPGELKIVEVQAK